MKGLLPIFTRWRLSPTRVIVPNMISPITSTRCRAICNPGSYTSHRRVEVRSPGVALPANLTASPSNDGHLRLRRLRGTSGTQPELHSLHRNGRGSTGCPRPKAPWSAHLSLLDDQFNAYQAPYSARQPMCTPHTLQARGLSLRHHRRSADTFGHPAGRTAHIKRTQLISTALRGCVLRCHRRRCQVIAQAFSSNSVPRTPVSSPLPCDRRKADQT